MKQSDYIPWHPHCDTPDSGTLALASRKVPEEGMPLLWESSASTFTLTTEGCPQATYNWCTPPYKCGWVPPPTRTHSCVWKATPGQNNLTKWTCLQPPTRCRVRRLEASRSATTTQVSWFDVWKRPVCNHHSGVWVRRLETSRSATTGGKPVPH